MGSIRGYHQGQLRPIMLTAVSTVLGLIPIAPTVFWGPMAFAIMLGFNQWSGLAAAVGTLPAPLEALLNAEIEITDAYRLRDYDGEATLFATRSGHAAECDPEKMWSPKLDLHG